MVVENNLFYIFEEQIRAGYLSYMDRQTGLNLVGFQRDYMPEYLSATVVSLMRRWAETGYHEPPERMADITVRLKEGYQKLLPMPLVSEVYKEIQNSNSGSFRDLESQSDSVSDILNNIPVGVCVLFMPDDTHQEVWFANKQQMRLINPNMTAPETVAPKSVNFALVITKMHSAECTRMTFRRLWRFFVRALIKNNFMFLRYD